eukprot:scaffold49582_cov75-Phaeocystis_antarctica.AAC.1
MGFCLIDPSSATCLQVTSDYAKMNVYNSGTAVPGNCLDFTVDYGATLSMMSFSGSTVDTINVPYASSSFYDLAWDKMAFRETGASETATINLECAAGCGSGSAGGSGRKLCNGGSGSSTSYSGCGCTVRSIGFGSMVFKKATAIYQ